MLRLNINIYALIYLGVINFAPFFLLLWRMTIDGGIGGSIAPIAFSTIQRSG